MGFQLTDLKPGVKVRFKIEDGKIFDGTLRGMYLSPQGPIIMIRQTPGSIISCNVPIKDVISVGDDKDGEAPVRE